MNFSDEAHFSNVSSAHRRWAQLHEFVGNVQFNGLFDFFGGVAFLIFMQLKTSFNRIFFTLKFQATI